MWHLLPLAFLLELELILLLLVLWQLGVEDPAFLSIPSVAMMDSTGHGDDTGICFVTIFITKWIRTILKLGCNVLLVSKPGVVLKNLS